MNIWLVVYRVACVAFAAIVIVAVLNIFLPRIRENEEKRKTSATMEEQSRAAEDMTKELRDQQERFRRDKKYLERVAREELGKAKPGETIFRFPNTETNDIHRHP